MPPIKTERIVEQMIIEDMSDYGLYFPGILDRELQLRIDNELKEVASVGRVMWRNKFGEWVTFALRNIARKRVKNIRKQLEDQNPRERMFTVYNETSFPLAETIEGPPSEKIKFMDFIRVERLAREGKCPPHKRMPYIIISAFLRGLTEEIPMILDYEIKIKSIKFKKTSYHRSDKALILLDLVIDTIDLPENIDMSINDDVIVEIVDDEVLMRWLRSDNEAQSIPKEFSGKATSLDGMNIAVSLANSEPGNDKAEVLIDSWTNEDPDLNWDISAEEAQMLLYDIYKYPLGVPEPKINTNFQISETR